ncbi:MAG: hypothetical protein U9Q82_11245 [Chloroflexota bacterium]|nr:hypothetical protein [Chloroflexota bacterium]
MAFHEVQGWPKEHYTFNGAYHERKVRCPWGERITTAAALDSAVYPYDSSEAFTNDIKITPERNSQSSDAGDGQISYNHAIVTANYTTDIKLISGDYISENLTIATEGVRWTHDELYWSNDKTNPLKQNEGPLRIFPKLTYTLQYHRLLSVPSMVYTHMGYLNSNTVFTHILGIYFNPYFLLYRGAVVTRQLTAAGLTRFNVKHIFSYDYRGGLGWNAIWRPGTGYAYIYGSDGNQVFPYPWTTF